MDNGATVDDIREAVKTLEDTERTARRVFGGAHPYASMLDTTLLSARAALVRALVAREMTSPAGGPLRMSK